MISDIASITLKPGLRDDFIARAQTAAIAPTRKQPGCIFHDLTAGSTDSDLAIFVERWESREALEAPLAAPHMPAWRPVSGPKIASRVVEIIDPAGVETL
ncbi:MAG TPA: antibiotic biosynthesis monooxygenase family protein [Devosiaceae bacterium]|nr:antibiotic biosynthesis monooxygenase family protein [Devosiaceae bacterium]